MNAQQEETAAVVDELIHICRDGQEGFRMAAEAIEDDQELKRLLSSFSLQRAKFAGELQSLLANLGYEVSPSPGSAAGTAHRGWLKLRSLLTLHDNHAILAECERGEDAARDAYMKAVAERLPEPLREAIERQRQEVLAAHNTVRALRDSTPSNSTLAAAGNAIRTRTGEAAAHAGEAWEMMREKGADLQNRAKEQVRRHPLTAVLAVLAAGFTVGLAVHLLRQRHHPEDRFRQANRAASDWLNRTQRKIRKNRAMRTLRDQVENFVPRSRRISKRFGIS